jgi:hypothetical protein
MLPNLTPEIPMLGRARAVLWLLLAASAAGCRSGAGPGGEMPTHLAAEYVPMPGAGNLPFSALMRVGPMHGLAFGARIELECTALAGRG